MTVTDGLDARILLALDDDPEVTTIALARSLGVARNTVQIRLRRLATEALGPFSQRVDPAALGYRLTAFVSLWISQSVGAAAAERLVAVPEVIEVHATTGDADLLAKVVARDTGDLRRVMRTIVALPGVNRSSTSISLGTELRTRTRPLLEKASLDAAVRLR